MSEAPHRSPFLALCLAGGAAIFSSTLAKSPTLPLFAQELGATPVDVGFIAAAATVVGIAVSLPAGVLSDWLGRRRVILGAMAVFATAPFLYLGVTTPWQLAAVRVYHGFATAIFGPVALALVADLFRAGRGERMGWYSSATLVGRSLAPPVGGAVLSASGLVILLGPLGLAYGPYRVAYLVCGVAGLLALALARRLPARPGAAGRPPVARAGLAAELRRAGQGVRAVIMSGPILLTSGVEAVQFVGYGIFETFVPLYAVTRGLPAWQIGLVLGAPIITTALTKPLMGRWSDRVGRRPMITAGLLWGAAALAALAVAGSFAGLLVVALTFGLGFSVVTASTAALTSELARQGTYGAALGVLSTIMDVGHAAGPPVGGLLISWWAYNRTFAAAGVLLAAAALAFWCGLPALVRQVPARCELQREAAQLGRTPD